VLLHLAQALPLPLCGRCRDTVDQDL
jgi:hypothetical protein